MEVIHFIIYQLKGKSIDEKNRFNLFLCLSLVSWIFNSEVYSKNNDSIATNGKYKILVEDADTFVLKSDGTLWLIKGASNTPRKFSSGVKDIFGSSSSCNVTVIKSDDSLWQLAYPKEGKDEKILDDVIFSSPGASNSLAIKKDGSLWTWGNNFYYQIGNGTNKDSDKPVKVLDDAKYAYFVGGFYAVAIKNDATLWSWGKSILLNDNCYSKPSKVSDDVLFAADYTILKNDGTLFNEMSNEIIAKDVVSLSSDYAHTGLITKDRSLYMYGNNHFGDLGIEQKSMIRIFMLILKKLWKMSIAAVPD